MKYYYKQGVRSKVQKLRDPGVAHHLFCSSWFWLFVTEKTFLAPRTCAEFHAGHNKRRNDGKKYPGFLEILTEMEGNFLHANSC